MSAQSSPEVMDPAGFFEFDLQHGAVRTSDGARVLLLTDNVIAPLVSTAVHNGDLTAVRRLGKEVGEHVRRFLGASARDLDSELVIARIAGVLALFGWGRLHCERWGHALVVVIEDIPTLDEDDLGVAALLGGVFSTLTGSEVACVPVADGRFVVVDPRIAEQVWTWAKKDGMDIATIVGRLTPKEGS